MLTSEREAQYWKIEEIAKYTSQASQQQNNMLQRLQEFYKEL